MIFRGKPLNQLTDSEFQEAVLQNNRLADALIDQENVPAKLPPNLREWKKKAEALQIEGIRRGLLQINGAHGVG